MGPKPTKDLQSQDCKVFMDIIDGLRSKGISRYIGLPFPVGGNLTTTFATELFLRYVTETSEERCRVSIQPGKGHTDDQRKKLEAFGFSSTFDEPDVGDVAYRACAAMPWTDFKRFCDVLRMTTSRSLLNLI
ncbi:hypothetical protein PG993_001375 [Apiospora rasikravindrae]|uniref:Uncharacterized protein n=1 Tax=Apiospora rasikravindrae TaxID=990691 RepID=A0ABR1UDX8_9PEZI